MARKTMPKPNAALVDFFMDNEVYASLFNDFLFGGRKVIDPNDLHMARENSTNTVEIGKKKRKIERHRDNFRKTSKGCLLILGIEDQDKIHYGMPLRNMLYDVLGYIDEIKAED